jgi:hypothetical protein
MPSRLCTPTLPLPLNDLPLRLEDRLQADTLAATQELMLTLYRAQDLLATLPDLPSPDLGTRPQQAATKTAPAPRGKGISRVRPRKRNSPRGIPAGASKRCTPIKPLSLALRQGIFSAPAGPPVGHILARALAIAS